MSRSKRKPYWTEGYGSKGKKTSKRGASRAVRNEKEIASGGAYKKAYCSWNICDFKIYDKKSSKVRRK